MHCCCCCCCTDALLWSQALDIEGFENMLVLLSEFIGVKRPHLHSSAIGDLVAMVLQQVSSTDGEQQQHLSSSSSREKRQKRDSSIPALLVFAYNITYLSNSSRQH